MMNAVIPFQHPQSKPQFAKRYAQRGLAIFPCWWVLPETDERGHLCACGDKACSNRGKHPVSKLVPLGHTMATNDAATIERWWSAYPEANIGMPMAANHLIGVDIDPRNGGYLTIEQIEAEHGPLVSEVLQFTGGGGEHRIFSAPKDASFPGKLGAGIDLKHNGYLIVEPSNHACGGSYEFEASSSILDEAPSPLPDWVKDLGRAQHIAAPSIVRQFADSEVAEVKQALAVINSDDRDIWLQVGMALHASFGSVGFDLWDEWSQQSAKYDPVDQTRVWNSFRNRGLDGVSKATIFGLAKQAGTIIAPLIEAMPASVVVDDTAADQIQPTAPAVPEHLLNIPGMLSQVVAHMRASSRKQQPVFSVSAALSLGSLLMGQLYESSEGDRTGLYLLSIGPSGCGKENGRDVVKHILHQAGLSALIGGEDVKSDAAVMSRMAKYPRTLFQFDEFGLLLQKFASPNAGGHEKAVVSTLMKLWTSNTTTIAGAQYSERERSDLEYPSVHLYMTTTGETLWKALTGQEILSGAINRMIFCETDRPDVDPVKPTTFARNVPEQIVEWAKRLSTPLSTSSNLISPVNPVFVPIDDDADAIFSAFAADNDAKAKANRGRGLDALYVRAIEHAKRVALVVAGSINNESPAIDKTAAKWAVDFVSYWLDRMVVAVASHVGDSDFERLCNAVLHALRKAGARGMTEGRELVNYCRPFRALQPSMRDQVIAGLIRNGDVVIGERKGIRGPATKVMIAAEFVQQEQENP
jgi:hypothetical protein